MTEKKVYELTVDSEFRDLIPPLNEEELKLLEESIVADGCESPLIVWNGVIVDGHNRYAICRKHKIPFAIQEKDFSSRDDAMLWMLRNQLGRRNLNDYQRGEMVLVLKNRMETEAEKRKYAFLKIFRKARQVEKVVRGVKNEKLIPVSENLPACLADRCEKSTSSPIPPMKRQRQSSVRGKCLFTVPTPICWKRNTRAKPKSASAANGKSLCQPSRFRPTAAAFLPCAGTARRRSAPSRRAQRKLRQVLNHLVPSPAW